MLPLCTPPPVPSPRRRAICPALAAPAGPRVPSLPTAPREPAPPSGARMGPPWPASAPPATPSVLPSCAAHVTRFRARALRFTPRRLVSRSRPPPVLRRRRSPARRLPSFRAVPPRRGWREEVGK
eukprot:1098498-Pleurochrysis_carterae.AAC.3